MVTRKTLNTKRDIVLGFTPPGSASRFRHRDSPKVGGAVNAGVSLAGFNFTQIFLNDLVLVGELHLRPIASVSKAANFPAEGGQERLPRRLHGNELLVKYSATVQQLRSVSSQPGDVFFVSRSIAGVLQGDQVVDVRYMKNEALFERNGDTPLPGGLKGEIAQ